MSNTTGFMGFKHIGFLSGSAPDYQLQALTVGSGNATAIYRGDPVVFASGLIVAATSTANAVHGIMDGAQYVDSSGNTKWSPFCPAAQTATVYILSAPGATFLVQTLLTSVVTATINKNIGFAVGAGTTIGGGFSGYTVDANTSATTNTLPFRIIGLASTFLPAGVNGTDNTTNNNQCVVTFNSQDFKAGVTGV
jgi:hypothetical protein